MHKSLAALLLAVVAAACQQKPADAPATLVPTAHAAPAGAATRPAPPSQPAETEAAKNDLSLLWAGRDDVNSQPVPLDGFFGPEYRRISFVFTAIHRDAQQPTLYHVAGKDLYNKVVSAFKGTITVTTITPLDQSKLDEGDLLDADPKTPLYSAGARFDFQEYPATRTAGRFTGTTHLDFLLDKGKPALAISENYKIKTPAQGAGVLYQGQWTSTSSAATKPLLLSGNAFITAPERLSNFGIGDRGDMFNPKYAKLGWSDYWANNEWWADAPKPTTNL